MRLDDYFLNNALDDPLILVLIATLLTLIYTGLMLFFIRGALLLGRSANAWADGEELSILGKAIEGISVSVIVPLRNEEAHAPATLRALMDQDYTGIWEIICVDDRSQDGTAKIVQEFCDRDSRFSMVQIPVDSPPVPSPKKRALAAGFAAAKGAVLLTTDADCMAPKGWIRSMARRFSGNIGIVQGPKKIRGNGTVISRYQEHEVFGLVSVEASTFALGQPMIASAPSLAYRKELYESVGGFYGLEDSVSGDDDLLVRKMQKQTQWQVAYNPSPDACVTTSPVTNWIELIQQRARWASNGAHYDEKGFVALLIGVYGFYWWLALSPIFAYLGWVPWFAFLIPALIKIFLSGIFLGITSRRLGHQGLLRDLVWCEILHVPIVIIAVILGHLGLYRWK
jgi:cellulose synthase/poly-beta-1,6-N-acetylglucosamine synthase-like glycosyltransferase